VQSDLFRAALVLLLVSAGVIYLLTTTRRGGRPDQTIPGAPDRRHPQTAPTEKTSDETRI